MKASRFLRYNYQPVIVVFAFILFSCNPNSDKKICDGQSSKKEYDSITLLPGPAEGDTINTNPAAFHWPIEFLKFRAAPVLMLAKICYLKQ